MAELSVWYTDAGEGVALHDWDGNSTDHNLGDPLTFDCFGCGRQWTARVSKLKQVRGFDSPRDLLAVTVPGV